MDTWLIWMLWHVPFVFVLNGFHCTCMLGFGEGFWLGFEEGCLLT